MTITELIVCIVAGLGAGLGTGLAGLSAAAVVSPMLITFLHMPAYQAIGIALASDVLASGVSAWTYKKNKNIDILFTYGAKAKHIAEGAKGFVDEIKSFDDKNELAKTLLETLKDGDAVLFKASRGMKLEDVINSLYREWEE
jgi:hypothetical protein